MKPEANPYFRNGGKAHQEGVDFLEALADLTGFSGRLPGLPGGLYPDVVRLRKEPRALLLGEAKANESEKDTEVLDRLASYLEFQKGFKDRTKGSAFFLLCLHGDAIEGGWLSRLGSFVEELGFPPTTIYSKQFPEGYRLIWIRWP
jgi:hypothetical protein